MEYLTLPSSRLPFGRCVLAIAVALLLGGCRQDMHQAPRYNPLQASDFFPDGRSARGLVPGTVARGQLRDDEALYQGKVNGILVSEFPIPVTAAMMTRGRERFNVFCAPCHGRTAQGNGMVVQRGFKQPPALFVDRLRQQPIGYFYDVIAKGFGVMPDYASQIPVVDRWAIVASVRALQLAEHATLADVPPDRRGDLEATSAPGASGAGAGTVSGHQSP